MGYVQNALNTYIRLSKNWKQMKNQANKKKRPSENEQSTVGSSGQAQASSIHCCFP